MTMNIPFRYDYVGSFLRPEKASSEGHTGTWTSCVASKASLTNRAEAFSSMMKWQHWMIHG